MRQQAQNNVRGLGETWKGQSAAGPEAYVGTVRTLHVKNVGTPRDPAAQLAAVGSQQGDTVTTQRFVAMPRAPRDPQDDRRAAVRAEAFQQAIALARTIPAVMPEDLGVSATELRAALSPHDSYSAQYQQRVFGTPERQAELTEWDANPSSGVHRIGAARGELSASDVRDIHRLELWLEPRDRSALAASSGNARAQRYTDNLTVRMSSTPLTRARLLWQEMPAPLAICVAGMLCFLSVVALGLLAN